MQPFSIFQKKRIDVGSFKKDKKLYIFFAVFEKTVRHFPAHIGI